MKYSPNSIAFRNIQPDSNNNPRSSAASAELNIDTGSGSNTGTVALVDPIWGELDNGKTFTMTVSGEGELLWGGKNTVTVLPEDGDSSRNVITLGDGSTTITLLEGFSLTAPNHKLIINGSTLQLTASEDAYTQNWTLANEKGNAIEVTNDTATLSGKLTGTGGFTKSGDGILTLSSTSNDYTGGTTIIDGLVNFNKVENFGSGQITLNGGGLQWAKKIPSTFPEN